ncbi:MAG: arginase [Saprospiraceae bacterium]
MSNKVRIVKNRSDIGAGTRGSDLGIDAIEIAAINQNNDFFNRYEAIDVETHNETIYNMVKNSFGKRMGHVLTQCNRVSEVVKDTLEAGYFPLIMAGDHSSALGSISGIKAAYPEKRLGAIWIDAHADLHSPYTTPSGNVHGMPLAAALALDNKDFQVNTPSAITVKDWEGMKNIGVKGAKIQASDLIFFGVRDTELPEDKLMEDHKIRNFTVEEMRFKGIDSCMKMAIQQLEACDIIYISFDVDSLDCDMISYGTGTPVAKGFDQYEVIQIIKALLATQKVVSLECVEVNPLLDTKGNKMAETAFEVLDAVIKS